MTQNCHSIATNLSPSRSRAPCELVIPRGLYHATFDFHPACRQRAGAGCGAAAEPADAPVAATTEADAAIVVVGQGEVRQAQTLSIKDLAVLAPATSPLKAIENLPSVNFQSADPFGAYEWATRVSIRGFNQNQLGFTLDGVPLGDATYGNLNGLHISRAIITDNIGATRVTQGAGALGRRRPTILAARSNFQP
jgi:iron complex outermembrane receptor protein